MTTQRQIKFVGVEIVRFVDKHQPGFVECELVDAEGRKHKFMDKVPIFTAQDLDSSSAYPQSGSVRCEVLAEWRDPAGRALSQISTIRPDDVESSEGLSEFIVLSQQVSEH
jgi:hypothetical protein